MRCVHHAASASRARVASPISIRRRCSARCSTVCAIVSVSIAVDVDDVVCGNGSHAGDHAHDIGRMAVLDAGWPVSVPGVTLNRFCGSGQQAVTFAAMGVGAGHQQLVVGAGVESMSRPARNGTDGLPRQQRTPARHPSSGAAGPVGRPDRHARRLDPGAVRCPRSREPTAGRGRVGGGAVRSQPRDDRQRRRLGRARPRGIPAARRPRRRGSPRSRPAFRRWSTSRSSRPSSRWPS